MDKERRREKIHSRDTRTVAEASDTTSQARKTYKEIGAIIGIHKDTVWKWSQRYKAGAKGLEAQKRGRRHGAQRKLGISEEAQIRKLIINKAPDQLKLTFALWTRQAVGEIIRLKLGIKMPIRTLGEYLKRWHFTPQKPLKQADEQQPEAVKKWLQEEYLAIAQRAKKEGGEIHWGDETGIRSDSQHGRSYAPKGKTPVIRLSAKRCSLNLISTVTNQGKVRFMIYKETMNAEVLIKFMKQLIKGSDKKIFLILDNLRVHHAKIVKAWLKEDRSEIEVSHLASYSPELNPDEYLNCDVKAGVHSRPPARVSKYFKHPKIAYAA